MSFKAKRKFIIKVLNRERKNAERICTKKYNTLADELNKAHAREIELLNKGFKVKTKRIDRLQENLSNVILNEEKVLSEIKTQHETVKRCAEALRSAVKDNQISLAVIKEYENDSDDAHTQARKAG